METYRYALSKFRAPILRAIGLGLSSVITIEISRTFLRPVFGKGHGLIPDILGVLPNFLAAFGLPFVILGAYYCRMLEIEHANLNTLKSDEFSPKQLVVGFLVVTVFNAAGLILWEFFQLDDNLIFASKDIVATLLGAGSSFYVFSKTSLVKK